METFLQVDGDLTHLDSQQLQRGVDDAAEERRGTNGVRIKVPERRAWGRPGLTYLKSGSRPEGDSSGCHLR